MTVQLQQNRSVELIKQRISHPIIDSDAHIIEYLPDVKARLRRLAGPAVANRLDRIYSNLENATRLPIAVRRSLGMARAPWWNYPAANALDRATASLPRLLHRRLDEFGIDVAVVYPSYFIQFPTSDDEEFRRAGCRATNQHLADTFADVGDRLIPVGAIPMHTPDEALAEMQYLVEDLGMRAVVLPGSVVRRDEVTNHVWLDTFGLDSEFDYDPVWKYLEEHGLAATFHSAGMGWGSRASVTNYMHNHVGHFAAAGEAILRSLLFSGVPNRFPTLRFAFLEGGASWAASLFNDFSGHFAKRRATAIGHFDPRHLDIEVVRSLFIEFGTNCVLEAMAEFDGSLAPLSQQVSSPSDDFARSGFESSEEIRKVFEDQMFFGCEADDRMNIVGSEQWTGAIGARIRTILGSDIGHWDVADCRMILSEAYEMVEAGCISHEDFEAMTYHNPVSLWTGNCPDFFRGTALEGERGG